MRQRGILAFGCILDSIKRHDVVIPPWLKFRAGTELLDINSLFFLMLLKKMRNQDLSLFWDVSDTYQGSLVSFLVINPEQGGERKLVMRVLILSTF